MTKFVTATDALVLSPPQLPDDPTQLPDVFDDFARALARLADGTAKAGWSEDRASLGDDVAFSATPLLADGHGLPELLPAAWAGRITPTVVASYFSSDWLLHPRPASWGAYMAFDEVEPGGDARVVRGHFDAKHPIVDPLRDSARVDESDVLPLRPQLAGPFAELLTDWEHVDGLLASDKPGPAWLDRRVRPLTLPSGRLWWELRGLRDAGDLRRYGEDMWSRPQAVTAYLGWPAYFISAAGETRPCEACGRAAIGGRRFCGSPECDRARTAARQRLRRGYARRS